MDVAVKRKCANISQMPGSDPQLWIVSVVILGTVLSLLGSVTTWFLSRAKKVRDLEDLVLGAVRSQEMKLAEWQTTITGILAQVEEFFERTVRERKRTQLAANKLRDDGNGEPRIDLDHMESLPRAMQLELVRKHFEGH